jgi:peptide-methionine (S)-S-oxide reductase
MQNMETIILGGGCFWCIEAVYQRIQGVHTVTSGYTGGHTQNPSYEEVSNADTGHAEVVKIDYNPKEITLEKLLETFWRVHNPTTLNKQGHDIGSQYRSCIYYTNEAQLPVIEKSITAMAEVFQDPIVTLVEPLSVFYPAEEYHQNYFNKHPESGYCQLVIAPKLQKIHKE